LLSSAKGRSARDYLALTPDERQKTLLVADTNQERLAIAQLVRDDRALGRRNGQEFEMVGLENGR